jgi:hypothetical protein
MSALPASSAPPASAFVIWPPVVKNWISTSSPARSKNPPPSA